jgi:hypothetical protein
VEGFSILASQLISGADLAVSEGAHHPGVLLAVRAWISSSSGVAICIRFFLYCDYCKLYLLYLIYTLDLKTGFLWGGFVQGHVDQKYLCLQMHFSSCY